MSAWLTHCLSVSQVGAGSSKDGLCGWLHNLKMLHLPEEIAVDELQTQKIHCI
jgi:hypothetical protein